MDGDLPVMTTTLWDYASRTHGEGGQGDNAYVGSTPSYLIANLLARYTRPGQLVVDPMCGSGTTLDVARQMDRRALGYDVAPSRPDIFRADARKLPLEDAKADFVFVDPPYSNHVRYSGRPDCIGELDARGDAYYPAMEAAIADMDRVLRPERFMALYVSDSFELGKPFEAIGFKLFGALCRHFTPVDIVAVCRHNRTLMRNHWHTSAVEGNYLLRGFNYLFIMYKEKGRRPIPVPDAEKPVAEPTPVVKRSARAERAALAERAAKAEPTQRPPRRPARRREEFRQESPRREFYDRDPRDRDPRDRDPRDRDPRDRDPRDRDPRDRDPRDRDPRDRDPRDRDPRDRDPRDRDPRDRDPRDRDAGPPPRGRIRNRREEPEGRPHGRFAEEGRGGRRVTRPERTDRTGPTDRADRPDRAGRSGPPRRDRDAGGPPPRGGRGGSGGPGPKPGPKPGSRSGPKSGGRR